MGAGSCVSLEEDGVVKRFIDRYPEAADYYHDVAGGDAAWHEIDHDQRLTWTQRWIEARELNEPKAAKDPRCTGPFHEGHVVGECPYGYNGPENVCPVHLDIACPGGCPYFARPRAEPAPDLVNHPPHYETNGPPCAGCGRPIQCIEVREHMSANISDALKYLWRHGDKAGADPVQDLRKSLFYIEREIKRLGGGAR